MNYKNLILNRLLDKFEKSKTYLGENKLNRKILLKLSHSEFPEYDIENTDKKENINSSIQELTGKGIIEYEWLKFEQGNIIEKVWLIPDKIDDIYREAERIPKKTKVNNILTLFKEANKSISESWIKKFIEDMEISIEATKNIPSFLPDGIDIIKSLIDGLKEIDKKGNEEYLERVFSLKCFGDLKFFEKNLKRKFIEIIKKYFLQDDIQDFYDEEILAQIGVVKSPEQFDFCGGITGVLNEQEIDFSVFNKGISINSHTAKELDIKNLKYTTKLLFIENKANYIDYTIKKIKEKELIIFHGGFYSPIKGTFFKKIYEAGYKSGIKFYHWGDIDAGGFRIFNRLKNNIIPELKPYLMDKDAFISKQKYWKPFDKSYGSILLDMMEKEDFREFHDVIGLMLKECAKLEQEAFLL